MTESAAAAHRFGKSLHSAGLKTENRLKNKLRHAVPAPDGQRGIGGIEQPHDDFSAIVGVDHPDALRNDQSLDGAETAAGIKKARNAGNIRFDTDAGRNTYPAAGLHHDFLFLETGPQIHAGGIRRRVKNSASVHGSGISKITNINTGHDRNLSDNQKNKKDDFLPCGFFSGEERG